MTDESQLHEQMAAGDRARALLEDEALQAAFEDVRQAFRDDWENSPGRDPEMRERMYYGLRGVKLAWAALQARLDNGKIAASQLEKLNEEAQ